MSKLLAMILDTVCQSKLIEVLSRGIKDGSVISLIHKYLNTGVTSEGIFEKTEESIVFTDTRKNSDS